MASDHTTNPLTAGGGCIFVGVRVRPLVEGRTLGRGLVRVDQARGKIAVGFPMLRENLDGTKAVAAVTRLQALQRGKSVRKLVQQSTAVSSAKAAGSSSTELSETSFTFASVFREEDNQRLFELVGRPLVNNVCIGFNGTLFAYGQTGSGKTYTIGEIGNLGSVHEGVAHRTVRELYQTIKGELGDVMEYSVRVQFVQVSCSELHVAGRVYTCPLLPSCALIRIHVMLPIMPHVRRVHTWRRCTASASTTCSSPRWLPRGLAKGPRRFQCARTP